MMRVVGGRVRIILVTVCLLCLTGAVVVSLVWDSEALVLFLEAAGAATATTALTRPSLPSRSGSASSSRKRWWDRWGWWSAASLLFLVAATAATVAVLVWLLGEANQASEATRAAVRIDAIRTSLGVAAGLGALVALGLALRRQWHTERHDTEQRVTELYVAAAEQLGSDKAPVRLAGLYALSRLGQDNPNHRQTIVDVICAYLRMPYHPPGTRTPRRSGAWAGRPPRPGLPTTGNPTSAGTDPHEERQVRLTAQRLLAHHLNPDGPAFWPDMDIDLSGATLIDLDMSGCRLRRADFTHATFTGTARFNEATFTGTAQFNKATFKDDAWFYEATFKDDAQFDEATLTSTASFLGATFTGRGLFHGCRVVGLASRPVFDAWPPGWRVVPDPDHPGDGLLEEINDDPTPDPTASSPPAGHEAGKAS